MDQHADDLAALLDYLKIRRAVVAGLSMGAYVAFAFWRRYPGRVRGLILADTRRNRTVRRHGLVATPRWPRFNR